jgi:spore maturation protein CgeB
MLLADRTEEHQEFFEEEKEAEFFDSPEELIEKLSFYSKNGSARTRIADKGCQRCKDSGYSYVCRMKDVLRELRLS